MDEAQREFVVGAVEGVADVAGGGGLFVSEEALAGGDVFRLRQFPAWTLCTDTVRQHVEKQGYTNVEFLEMGETF